VLLKAVRGLVNDMVVLIWRSLTRVSEVFKNTVIQNGDVIIPHDNIT
jgi:hypothetical protein